MSLRIGAVCACLALGGVALADGDDDAVRAGLKAQKRYAEVGHRIAALERDYRAAEDGEWIPKAILLVELADLDDRRAIAALGRALHDEEAMVVAFALHGLSRQDPEHIRKGGGVPLAEGLLEHVDARNAYLSGRAQALLGLLTGQSFGRKDRKWKKWLKEHGDELTIEIEGPPFDESAYAVDLVAKIRAEGDDGATSVRPRIPSVTSQLRELNDDGLDVVLCLDQTGSMGAVIEEAKANLTSLIGVIEQVVDDYRIGLATYHDGCAAQVRLSNRTGELRETLNRVQANGGGDFPEGVDKALDVVLTPKFGWRRDSEKCVVIVGDAPMHDQDVQRTLQMVAAMHAELGMRFNTVSTGGVKVPHFDELASKGGGQALELADTNKLVSEILLLIFGEPLRPAMERFVPVLLEVLAAAQGR